ncbi:MAG: SDR family NAD(P)-dependent oxidoreductase [Schleiferiaceae bacterium]|jgi:NADP-dependent 3-hydroxy acid dehydrogenase YdfG|nr:SDR family NAD(P)-dependent oxidoreductase [Schleiferiaceae bacterium]
MSKIALITGATSGIGMATAFKMAEQGYNLILTGRREDRLQSIKTKLLELNIEVLTLCFDIRLRTEVEQAVSGIPKEWKNIDVLVNNAGLASGKDPLQSGDIDRWESMIDTNVKGLLYMSRMIIPNMEKKKSGHIINIGSTAGKEVYPGGNVYCATKFAVDALSKGMRIDLVESGVKVTQIRPGLVETEFSKVRFDWDEEAADKVYENLEPLFANDVAEMVIFAVNQPPHVCINDLEVTCTAQATSTIVHRS